MRHQQTEIGQKGFTAPLFAPLRSQQHLGVTCLPLAHERDAVVVQMAQHSGTGEPRRSLEAMVLRPASACSESSQDGGD